MSPFFVNFSLRVPVFFSFVQSPDWFTGFYDLQPVEDGKWMNSFSVSTYPWDAGTDSGTTYNSANQATNPQEGIFQMTPDKLPSSNVFLSPDGEDVRPVARWECSIVAETNDTLLTLILGLFCS